MELLDYVEFFETIEKIQLEQCIPKGLNELFVVRIATIYIFCELPATISSLYATIQNTYSLRQSSVAFTAKKTFKIKTTTNLDD